MNNDSAPISAPAVSLENLESFARQKIGEFLQLLLEEEVTELLGRSRRDSSDHWSFRSSVGNGSADKVS